MIHETQPQWQKKSYHSVVVVVSVIFLIMFLAGIIFAVYGKQRASAQLERQSFSTEQQLLKALLDEPLLRYDFAQMTATLTHFF